MEASKKKRFSFPTAFTVLFIVLILAAILTAIVPAGSYDRLAYDADTKAFTITKADETSETLPGTQATLDKMGIKVNISKFEDASIRKPLAIPGTYMRLDNKPQGALEVLKAPVTGVGESFDIILFVFIIGGCIGVLNASGAIGAGLAALSRATKGKEYMLIIFITFLIGLGGTTFGMAEETIALYPIMIPIFLIAGYDAIVCIAAIYMGSSIGTMFSTVNPFSSVIASNAAGITFTEGMTFRIIGLVIALIITMIYIIRYAEKVKKDPSKSIIAYQTDEIHARFLKNYDEKEVPPFTWKRILMLVLFVGAFGVMIYGVSSPTLGWWFAEMTTLFLGVGIILCFLSGLGEKAAVHNFIAGSADLVGVALTIGLARAINIVMDSGSISDTILYFASGAVHGMNGSLFSVMMMFVYTILGFFIPSSSGLAVLSMPIMAPLADTVGLSRDIIVSAYQYGQGLMAFITPTGLILATLSMVDVTYDKWLKFIMPLMGIIGAFAAVMLVIQAMF